MTKMEKLQLKENNLNIWPSNAERVKIGTTAENSQEQDVHG